MSRIGTQIKNSVIFIHRWMGVCFCLLFLLWFTSGIGMMYWSYPEVTAADRLSHAPVLDASRIRISPQEAYARLQTDEAVRGVRLETFDGRPVYQFQFGLGESAVYADTGEEQDDVTPAMNLRAAAAWTGQLASSAKVEENTSEDQWTVSGEFAALRPLLKYSWPDGEQVYVSTVTGDVVQYTTQASRIGAYFSAIPHWLYFTPLRKHANNWSRFVIWSSGLATIVAILGIVVGVCMYSPSRQYKRAESPSSIPYVGQKRWHMIFGLIFGPLACTWAFSGMLSMDPFPQLQAGYSDTVVAHIQRSLRGTFPPLSRFAAKSPQQALLDLGSGFGAKELELTSFLGEPVYLATAALNQSRIIPIVGNPKSQFDPDGIVNGVRQGAQPAQVIGVRTVTQYESYYLDRHHVLPLPVIFLELNDAGHSMFYVDPKTARIVASYDSHSRRNRWLYHGLHSMDLPWLYKHRPMWDFTVLTLLLGGAALCVTSLILAYRVVRRKIHRKVQSST